MRTAVGAILACAFLTTGVAAAQEPRHPSAFQRAATAADELPASFADGGLFGEGRPYASRRIATLRTTKRSWSVYIFKQMGRGFDHRKPVREHICVFTFQGGGGGGGCSPSATFFGKGRDLSAGSSRVLAGVASDRVARVVVVGSEGVVHRVPLTPDKGFIFNCRAYNGCACVISRLQAFDENGARIENQDWRSSAPNCRR